MARNPHAVARALPAPSATQASGGFGGAPSTMVNGISPLVASYDAWSYGRPTGPGLDRDWAAFLSGSFGPLAPIQPVPIDQPAESGRPEPRRFEYRVGWNMPIGVPGDEGLKLSSFQNLRTVADAYSVARTCIQTRVQEILGLEWDIIPSSDAEKSMRGDHKARADFESRRAQMLKFWRKPDPG